MDRDTAALKAAGFNELIEASAPNWARSADATAAELLNLDAPFDAPVEFYLQEEIEGGDTVVTVTLTRLGSDSVDARRYRVVFSQGEDGLYRFVSGEWSQRCASGRGHQGFTTGTCR